VARKKALTLTTIKSAWRKAGLVPLNPREVYKELPRESIPRGSKSSSSSISPSPPRTLKAFRRLSRKVIHLATSSPERRAAGLLSSGIENLFVENALLRADLVEAKKALELKSSRSRRKLVGPGLFTTEDLESLKRGQDEAASKRARKKPRLEALKGATRDDSSPTPRNIIEVEEGDCIVVRLWVN